MHESCGCENKVVSLYFRQEVLSSQTQSLLTLLVNIKTHPRHHKLSSQILHFGFDFTADIELVAVQGDALQISQQILLARWIWTLQREKTRSNDGTEPFRNNKMFTDMEPDMKPEPYN